TIETSEAFSYSIYDLNGRTVLHGKGNNTEVISLHALMNGQYILSLTRGNSTRNLKVTKL
ncbi:MAG: T9SS type A sorting domain-containing protein, partial [Flavobacteriales bacterium]